MNQLLELEAYRNRYFVMRHGHSEANRRGLIVSDPRNGVDAWGLSDRGRGEVEASLRDCRELDSNCRIISSDFRRARETAAIALRELGCRQPLETDARLRERFFGDFEMQSNTAYRRIWREDAENPNTERDRVESANQVTRRVTSLIVDLEREFAGRAFLLVSHGDTLQLLLTAFAGRDAGQHRDLEALETAEIRELATP